MCVPAQTARWPKTGSVDARLFDRGQAKRKEEVVDALGTTTTRLRAPRRIASRDQEVRRSLAQATTASLDALKAYSLALITWNKQDDRASLPFFQKAIEIDPKFARGYASLAVNCHNLGGNARASDYATKAYELKDRGTEQQRLSMES